MSNDYMSNNRGQPSGPPEAPGYSHFRPIPLPQQQQPQPTYPYGHGAAALPSPPQGYGRPTAQLSAPMPTALPHTQVYRPRSEPLQSSAAPVGEGRGGYPYSSPTQLPEAFQPPPFGQRLPHHNRTEDWALTPGDRGSGSMAASEGGNSTMQSVTSGVPPPGSAMSSGARVKMVVAPPNVHVSAIPTREEVVEAAIEDVAQRWTETAARIESDGQGRLMHGESGGTCSADKGGTSMSLKDVEFRMGFPLYTGRLGLLFVISLFGVLPLMSGFSLTVLLLGLVVVYISDYLGYHRGTVLVLLTSLGLFAFALLLSNAHAAITSLGQVLMIVDIGVLLSMVAAASMQHFRWMQETYPHVICLLERMIFAVTPIVCLPLILTTSTAMLGARYAPGAFFVAMCVLHHYFYCPLRSSFLHVVETTPVDSSSAEKAKIQEYANEAEAGDDERTKGTSSPEVLAVPQQLNEQPEAVIFSVLLLVLPMAMYNAVQSNWDYNILGNLLNSIGLVSGGIVYFCLFPESSLWFLVPPQDESYSVFQQLEYDPKALQEFIKVWRYRVLSVGAFVGSHWGAYRVVTSRYWYLFSGVVFPFNSLLLLIALYIAIYVGIETKRLVDADACGESLLTRKYLQKRISIVAGSAVISVILCVLVNAPGVFYFPSVLSVTSLNVFLMDRTNGGPMVSFTVFSSLLLLWWMYRTYSFIIVDLRVFGEAAVIPTPVLAVNILCCYVLGCVCFTLSFSPSKPPLVAALFLLALQVTWVEHVLYSQDEEGAYPAILVFFTSGLGIQVAYRMYKNEVLGVSSASFIASCYSAKIVTFAVEVTSAYYATELANNDDWRTLRSGLLVAELTGTWWLALFAGYIVIMFEMERRRRIEVRAARRMTYSYAGLALLLSLLTIRSIQRSTYELLTQSYVPEQELLYIAPGSFLLTYALLTLPVWYRLQKRYVFVAPLQSISRAALMVGVVLLAVQPTRVFEDDVSALDNDFLLSSEGRYATVLGFFLILATRVISLPRFPFFVRIVYWLAAAASLAFGICGFVQMTPTFSLFAVMLVFVLSVLLIVDAAHYRNFRGSEFLVLFVLSALTIPLSFLFFYRSFVDKDNQDVYAHISYPQLRSIFMEGGLRLMAVAAGVHLSVAVLLNCRVNNRSLLPRCIPLSEEASSSVALVVNLSTELAVLLLCSINFYGSGNEPALYVLLSLLLLLSVDDGLVFVGLKQGSFRYFPPVVCALGLLWWCNVTTAWGTSSALSVMRGIDAVMNALFLGAFTLPSQGSLLYVLWNGKQRGGVPAVVVIGSILLNVLCLLFISSDKSVQWMAIVGICGQCVRLFSYQLSRPKRRKPLSV